MLIQKANNINALMRAILSHVENTTDGISSRTLRTNTGMNTTQFYMLTELLVRTKRIVNENGQWRIATTASTAGGSGWN